MRAHSHEHIYTYIHKIIHAYRVICNIKFSEEWDGFRKTSGGNGDKRVEKHRARARHRKPLPSWFTVLGLLFKSKFKD
jgi:hypothetical protein